jgi:glyoxylase-like metal-dependent hydrolase (beta-lactamase superfamily II)
MAAPRVHHLSCGTLCPRVPVNEHRELAVHVLAIETPADGVVLVDTGFGLAEAEKSFRQMPRGFRLMGRPRIERASTAAGHIEALGFSPRDVRHIVVTHLDLDHAGGLRDFPEATVHLHARELAAARDRRPFRHRLRYLPYQFEGVSFTSYDDAGDEVLGLPAVRALEGIEADIALIPLFGHSMGHSGVAVSTGERWLLHAGDAYFHHSELEDPPRGTWALNRFQNMTQVDREQRLENRRRLGELARSRDDVDVFSAHDPIELERLRGIAPGAIPR